jgi:hypothetical protein
MPNSHREREKRKSNNKKNERMKMQTTITTKLDETHEQIEGKYVNTKHDLQKYILCSMYVTKGMISILTFKVFIFVAPAAIVEIKARQVFQNLVQRLLLESIAFA